MNLTVTCQLVDERALLSAAGSVDVSSRDRLASAADGALRDGATSVVVDLSAVTFMDSTGVGALIEIAGRVDDVAGTFHIRHPSRPVARLLEVSGLSGQWLEGPAG